VDEELALTGDQRLECSPKFCSLRRVNVYLAVGGAPHPSADPLKQPYREQ